MKPDNDRPANFGADDRSRVGEILAPLTVAVVPAGLFKLLGFITEGLGKPGAEPPC